MEGVTIGRIVHYVDPDSGADQAAIITSVRDGQVAQSIGVVDLTVFHPRAVEHRDDVPFSRTGDRGSWHWPVRT